MEMRRMGRPSGLGEDDLLSLRKDLRSDPVLAGYPDRRWTGRLLKEHLGKNYGTRLSVRQCQRLLKNLMN
jgi:hypothetical protein